MNILTVSGSSRANSSNISLLNFISTSFPSYQFTRQPIEHIPLFASELVNQPLPLEVQKWKEAVANADGVIFCTPEYIFNIPAQIKNALEWFAASGELVQKPTLAITYTPHEPRGEKAMQSLLWCLQALDAKVLASLSLYHADISFDNQGQIKNNEGFEIIEEAIALFSEK